MLKRILVPLDTSEFTIAATHSAAMLATTAPASGNPDGIDLTGLGLVDMDQLPTGRFASLVPREQILAEAEETVRGLVEAFRKRVKEAGVPDNHVHTRQAVGSPFSKIIRESVFNDLIVLGEQCSFPPAHNDYLTLRHLYHEASRPILLTRRDFNQAQTVVMAMDGTAPASRMMYTYTQLNPFPGARVVLMYSKTEAEMYNLGEFFSRVEVSLRDHGMNVASHPVAGELESEIPAVVKSEKAQVLAVGIHGTQFMDRIRDPLDLRPHFAQRLLASMEASLFVVH